jgi:hypothetical protein
MTNPLFTSFGNSPFDDWANEILGESDFVTFTTPFYIDGLARVVGDQLDILAVHSLQPAQGNLRRFIDQAKATYKTIAFFLVWNEILNEILIRYGFKAETKLVDGKPTTILVYRHD